jgi:hypothetical protein
MIAQAERRFCAFFLARLANEITRLKEIPFPGHAVGPRKWLNLVSGLIDTAESYLSLAAKTKTSPSEASKLIQDAERLGDLAYRALGHVAGSDATQIPHEIVAPMQRWVDGVKIKNTIFFRAEHLPNYELAWFDWKRLKTDLNRPSRTLIAAIDRIDWPVLRVTVPGQALGMLPHYAVIGHELGHGIQDEIKPDLSAHTAELQACIQRITVRLAGSGFGSKERLQMADILGKWVNELKADAVGHYLAGPAFYLALCGYLELAGRTYGISQTHPPSDLRRRLLVNELGNGSPSHIEVFEDKTGLRLTETVNSLHVPVCPPADQLFRELRRTHGVGIAAICVELVPYLEVVAHSIYAETEAYLQKVASELLYRPEHLALDLDRHLELIRVLVPPIEYRDAGGLHPVSLAAILNVGWAALLTRLDRMDKPRGALLDPSAAKMEQLHELLLRAVELSEARRLWEEHT